MDYGQNVDESGTLDAIVSAPDEETHGIAAPAQGYFPGLALPTGHTGYRND